MGQLSGGQQAQVALAVALARHPRLLILDEPVAELDPLARHDFMSTLMEAVAADGVSVVFSSHVLSELERVCDYLILLSHGSVQIAEGTDELLATHRVLTGPVDQADAMGRPCPWYTSGGLAGRRACWSEPPSIQLSPPVGRTTRATSRKSC